MDHPKTPAPKFSTNSKYFLQARLRRLHSLRVDREGPKLVVLSLDQEATTATHYNPYLPGLSTSEPPG
jgi:hypothetical protein